MSKFTPPEKPSPEEVMTYKVALRHQVLETLYRTYRLCCEGKRLPEDFGTTIEELRVHGRNYRLQMARNHLAYIENYQSGHTTHELLDEIEECMREFNISFDEVDTSEAAFAGLRTRCKPPTHPLVALHTRTTDTALSTWHPRPR